MKIYRPAENRAVVPFRDVKIGDCFELDGRLYIKSARDVRYANAMVLQGCGCAMTCIASDTQCIPVDVEISYTYKPNAG